MECEWSYSPKWRMIYMLTKNQFVKKLAKKTGTSVAVSKEIVNSFLEAIQEAVYEDCLVSFFWLFKISPEDVP